MVKYKDRQKEYYRKNKEKIVAYVRKWQQNNPEKMQLYRKRRSKKQSEYYKQWYKNNGRNR